MPVRFKALTLRHSLMVYRRSWDLRFKTKYLDELLEFSLKHEFKGPEPSSDPRFIIPEIRFRYSTPGG